MKKIIILHNTSAGDEDHFQTELVRDLRKAEYDARYYSIENAKEWKKALESTELIVIAGGDGTVRRVAGEMVKWDLLRKRPPLALLPMGTANNLARALGVDPDLSHREHIANWKISSPKRFDMGVILNGKAPEFFIESAGLGLFPALIQHMKTLNGSQFADLSAEESIRLAQDELYKLAKNWEAKFYRIETDQGDQEGEFLLIEAMNIPSIGPILKLCPHAVMEDGYLDLVCIEEAKRKELLAFIKDTQNEETTSYQWPYLRVKSATIHGESSHMHVDDRVIETPTHPLIMEARENILEFMAVPDLTI